MWFFLKLFLLLLLVLPGGRLAVERGSTLAGISMLFGLRAELRAGQAEVAGRIEATAVWWAVRHQEFYLFRLNHLFQIKKLM